MPDASGKARLRWLLPDFLFDGENLTSGIALGFDDSKVTALQAVAGIPPGTKVQKIAGVITPGFVDLQVNGGGGVLLNQNPTVSGMQQIAAAHHALGSVAILPTVITDAPEVLAQAADAALAAKGIKGVVGLHIEGPHISVARRGTHAARFVKKMNDTTINIVRCLRAQNIPVMITLAPEAANGAQIAALAKTGAVVSLGHSDACAETTRKAIAAGARCFTHLFNAMSPLISRAPGMTGAAINSEAYTGIICDGIHVADELIAMAIRARPVKDRIFLVSDAMPTVGGPDSFDLYGDKLHLHNGRLVNAEGALAGAHTTMAESVERLVRHAGIEREQALRMAISIPAGLMQLPKLSRLQGRDLDDVLLLDPDLVLKGRLCNFSA